MRFPLSVIFDKMVLNMFVKGMRSMKLFTLNPVSKIWMILQSCFLELTNFLYVFPSHIKHENMVI